MQTLSCWRNDMLFALLSWRSPLPAGATRTERWLRCDVTAYRVMGAIVHIPFVTFRTDADDACARPIPEGRLGLQWAHCHAAPRRKPTMEERIWRKTTQRVYAVPMVALCGIIASCGNGAYA